MTAIFFPLAALLTDILVLMMFFSKSNIRNKETVIYTILLIINTAQCILDILLVSYAQLVGNVFVVALLQKIDIVMIIMWAALIFIYVYVVSHPNYKMNKIPKTSFIIAIIFSFLALILPITPIIEGEVLNSAGLSPDFAYTAVAIFAIGITVCVVSSIIKDKDNIKNRKYYPLYALILLAGIGLVLRSQIPSVIFEPFVMGYVVLMMYHTIENPDVKMIEQLNIAKDAADKANRAKTDFLSSMSHEIRTPLNAIVGFSECIKQSETLDEAKENADDIISASGTLLELVNGILDISKIEAGKIEIHNSSYNSKDLFNSIVKLAKGRLGEKPLDFRINIADDIPETLYGDHANVKKVIINILTNAIKYTEKGFIDLSIKCVNTNDICRLIISVEDSGRGIKEEDIDKLFTKFQRLDEDRNTTIEGTGLGLAITKQLIDLMGGKIVVNSTFGEGSKFTVALDQKISKTQVVKQEVKEEINLDLNGKTILIVDDNKLNLKVASKVLEKYHPIIETVESGMECLDKINSGKIYDLILMDDMMPRMSGGETLLRLKQIENFNMPVIALTANAITGMEEKYIKDGFDGYLAKPIDKEKLHQVLVRFIGNQKIEEKQEVNSVVQETVSNQFVESNDVLDLTGKKILVVDDNKLNIKVANTFLKKYNPTMEEVYSGIDCINKIKEGTTYDLIFMDDMMPEKSGVETFHELEKLENFNMPVVALTANAIEGMREQYLKEGFNEYLSKPINKDELDRILKMIFLNNNSNKIEDNKQINSLELQNNYQPEIKTVEQKEIIQPEIKQIDKVVEMVKPEIKEEKIVEVKKQEQPVEEKPILNKPNFEELPEELFEISNSELIAKPETKEEKKEEPSKKEELYKEKIETPKQFSPVYVTKEEYKNNIEYLKENNIDVDHGVELLGDIEMYNETMEEFYNNIKDRITKLRTFKENNDLANYAIEAHALKSDSKYLGFTELAERAFNHEMKSKENNIEYINIEFDRLLNAVNRVFNIIKKYLGK